MGDKDAIKQLGERIKKTLAWQDRVKEESAATAKEVEERERQEQA